MNKLICFLLFISQFSYAQNAEALISKDICICFDQKQTNANNNFDITLLESCFNEAVKKNANEIFKLLTKDVDTLDYDNAYDNGYEYGQKLLSDIQEQLINECDSYYKFSSRLSLYMLENMEKTSSQKNIDSLTKRISNDFQKINLIWERGANKIGIQDFDSAKEDFKICLNENPSYTPALFFLAWLYDLNGDSKEAIRLYEQLLNQDSELGSMGDIAKIYLAVNKRKLREGE